MEHIWKTSLQVLADSPDEFEDSGGAVTFTRQGQEIALTLRDIPGIGTAVIPKTGSPIPIAQYIQRDLLKLHILAGQINKSIEGAISGSKTPTFFIEVPSNATNSESRKIAWAATSFELERELTSPPSESTQIIELMAPAGFGKSFLLSHLAKNLATRYLPQDHPTPILLPVDLLGRHIGTLEDAIAGSLNNTYRFPGLSQTDVALCVRQRWLVLAFDGFDELVGRVGVRDAFNKLSQFVDQLEGCGSVIISARDGYFAQHEIMTGMNSYFMPSKGSHSTLEVALDYWTEKQGLEVFRRLGSPDPQKALNELLAEFDDDHTIVYHPYFLTNLAQLKINGQVPTEKLKSTNAGDARTKYLIELIIENRETDRKWRAVMTQLEVDRVLGYIAQEMWRTGSFRLSGDELQMAAQIELNDFKDPTQVVDIASKMPNHAAFEPIENKNRYRFAHDKIFHYYLGLRLAQVVRDRKLLDLAFIIQARELHAEILRWAAWSLSSDANVRTIIERLGELKIKDLDADAVARANLGQLIARLLPYAKEDDHISVSRLLIGGSVMKAQSYHDVTFIDCNFFECDISGAILNACRFINCRWSDIEIKSDPTMNDCVFVDGKFEIVNVSGRMLFQPAAIQAYFTSIGARFERTAERVVVTPKPFNISQDIVECVAYFIHKSTKTWFVTTEEIEEKFGEIARDVARAAQRNGIMNPVTKQKQGRPKSFMRFVVDRTKLMHGLDGSVSDANIVNFWRDLESNQISSIKKDVTR